MVVAADTSFLFSLYGNDDNTEKAIRWVKEHSQVLTLSVLNEFEFANALRFAEFKSFLSPGKAEEVLDEFFEDKKQGRVVNASCNLSQVTQEAMRLSSKRTRVGGHRSFDILHVASAVQVRAEKFLTFDRNQASLARHAGLQVPDGFV